MIPTHHLADIGRRTFWLPIGQQFLMRWEGLEIMLPCIWSIAILGYLLFNWTEKSLTVYYFLPWQEKNLAIPHINETCASSLNQGLLIRNQTITKGVRASHSGFYNWTIKEEKSCLLQHGTDDLVMSNGPVLKLHPYCQAVAVDWKVNGDGNWGLCLHTVPPQLVKTFVFRFGWWTVWTLYPWGWGRGKAPMLDAQYAHRSLGRDPPEPLGGTFSSLDLLALCCPGLLGPGSFTWTST